MESISKVKNENMLEMLKELVNIDSGSYDKHGIDQVGLYLKKLYENLGFQVEKYKNEDKGNNLVLRHKEAKNPNILILAHMDTVFSKGTAKKRPFSIEGDYAFGPGVIDMKASHVMLYFAICKLMKINDNSYKDIEIILNSDEEIGAETSRTIIEQKAKEKKYALVLEPARKDGSIVSSRRGVGAYTLEINGKAAHSGIEPEKGTSAIEALAYKIPKLHALSNQEQKINVNVGIIEGGSSINTIASEARAYIDVRINEVNQSTLIDEKIKDICGTIEIEGTQNSLSGGINRMPMVFTDDIAKLVSLIQNEAKKIGLNINHVSTGGGSDASLTAIMGVPTVDGLGPVGGEQHSENEYLVIKSLPERTCLFERILSRLSEN